MTYAPLLYFLAGVVFVGVGVAFFLIGYRVGKSAPSIRETGFGVKKHNPPRRLVDRVGDRVAPPVEADWLPPEDPEAVKDGEIALWLEQVQNNPRTPMPEGVTEGDVLEYQRRYGFRPPEDPFQR